MNKKFSKQDSKDVQQALKRFQRFRKAAQTFIDSTCSLCRKHDDCQGCPVGGMQISDSKGCSLDICDYSLDIFRSAHRLIVDITRIVDFLEARMKQ